MGKGNDFIAMVHAVKAFKQGPRVKEFTYEDWLACADFAKVDPEFRDADGRPNAELRRNLVEYFKDAPSSGP